jgi:hypothetical protein
MTEVERFEDTNFDTFSALQAKRWTDKIIRKFSAKAELFIVESVIPYVKQAAAQGNYTVELPAIPHKMACKVDAILLSKGFKTSGVLSKTSETETVLHIAWSDLD